MSEEFAVIEIPFEELDISKTMLKILKNNLHLMIKIIWV